MSDTAKIDSIYDFIDERLLEGQYRLVNAICEHWDMSSPHILTMALLTATLPAKHKLPSRAGLLAEFRAEVGDKVLAGLE